MKLIQKADAQILAQTLGDDILSALRQSIESHGEARMALSGGTTPVPLFNYLSQQDLDWSKVKITLVDERCVPTEHNDSNANLVRQKLLCNKAQSAMFYPLYLGKTQLQEIDQSFEDLARQELNAHFPDYSVVVLGMGSDAHTASIFPQAAERLAALDPEQHLPCLMTDPVSAKYIRITQTLSQLLKTGFLALHIVGQSKKNLLDSIVESGFETSRETCPISHFIYQSAVPLSVYFSA